MSEFHFDKTKKDGHSSTCFLCARERSRQWHKDNPERARQRAQRYYEEHAEEIKARARQYERDNQETVRARKRKFGIEHAEELKEYRRKNREHHKFVYKEWSNRNKEYARSPERRYYSRIQARKRRARIIQLPSNFVETDQVYALAYFGGRCAVCGKPPGLFHSLIFDHWIAVMDDDCPGTIPQNMVPLCNGLDGCNQKKSAMRPDKWLELEYGKEKAAQILARIEAYFSSLTP